MERNLNFKFSRPYAYFRDIWHEVSVAKYAGLCSALSRVPRSLCNTPHKSMPGIMTNAASLLQQYKMSEICPTYTFESLQESLSFKDICNMVA